MHTSSRFVVAIHLLVTLAYKRGERVPSEKLAWSLNTNSVVVRRVLGLLRDAGLVTSKRGPTGGFQLARDAGKITLLDAYEAVEDGSIFAFHPNDPNEDCPVGTHIQPVLHAALAPAKEAMKTELTGITVADVTAAVTDRAETPAT